MATTAKERWFLDVGQVKTDVLLGRVYIDWHRDIDMSIAVSLLDE